MYKQKQAGPHHLALPVCFPIASMMDRQRKQTICHEQGKEYSAYEYEKRCPLAAQDCLLYAAAQERSDAFGTGQTL